MNLALEFVALFTTALFVGAALYVNLVEHPARMEMRHGSCHDGVRSKLPPRYPDASVARHRRLPQRVQQLVAGKGTGLVDRHNPHRIGPCLYPDYHDADERAAA